MRLGAYIDENGNAFVGNIENTEYLHFDMPDRYTRVLNDLGGEIVEMEDVEHAFANHTPQGTGIYYDTPETFDFCNQ